MPTPEATRAEVRVELPWPDRSITPNGRGTWQKRARLTASARNTAKVLTLEQMHGKRQQWRAAALTWTLHPKTANFPDDNNAGGYVKAYCDGIADALRMNDASFKSVYQFGPPVKGGAVIVSIRGE